jgi:hypothetical protein
MWDVPPQQAFHVRQPFDEGALQTRAIQGGQVVEAAELYEEHSTHMCNVKSPANTPVVHSTIF